MSIKILGVDSILYDFDYTYGVLRYSNYYIYFENIMGRNRNPEIYVKGYSKLVTK